MESKIPTSDTDGSTQDNQCQTKEAPRFEQVTDIGDFSNQPEDSHVADANAYFDITPGSGVIVADFNNDGWQDVYLSRLGKDLLYFNQGGRHFTLEPEWTLPQSDTEQSVGGSAADFDGDGDFDIFLVTAFGRDRLLQNNGNEFIDVSEEYAISSEASDNAGAIWFDYDLDGDLDVFVAGHKEAYIDFEGEWPIASPNRLYQNNGSAFEEIALPHEPHESFTYAAAWLQTEAGQRPWLYVVNDFGEQVIPNRVYEQGDDQFEVVGNTGLDLPMAGMGISQGDLNGDGHPDILISDFDRVRYLVSNEENYWYDSAFALGMTADDPNQIYAWGVNLFDFENDGKLDAFANWGPTINLGDGVHEQDALYQPNSFWRNNGTGFEEMATLWEIGTTLISRGSVAVDLDQDGLEDLIVGNTNGPAEIWWGRCMNGNWLSMQIQLDGMNRHAIGAKVTVSTEEKQFTEWMVAGDSFASSGPPIAHFGLGRVEDESLKVEIVLPDGSQHEEWLPVNAHSIVVLDVAGQ